MQFFNNINITEEIKDMFKSEEMWNKILCGTVTKEEAISEYMKLGYSREYSEKSYSEIVSDVHKVRHSL